MAKFILDANGNMNEVLDFATPAPAATLTPALDNDPEISTEISTETAVGQLEAAPKNQTNYTKVSVSQGEFQEMLRAEEDAKRKAIVEINKNKNQFFGPDLERDPAKVPQEEVEKFATGPWSSGAIFRENKGLTGEATFNPATGKRDIDVNRLQHVHGGREMQRKLAPKILENLVSENDIAGNTPEEKHANFLAGQKQLQDEYAAISPVRSFIDNATFISGATLALRGMSKLGAGRDPSKPFIDSHLIPTSDYTTLTGDSRLTDEALAQLWKKQEPITSLAGTEGIAYNPIQEAFQDISATGSALIGAGVNKAKEGAWNAKAPELKGLEIDPRKYKSPEEFKAAVNERLHEDMLARLSKKMQESGESIGSASLGGLAGLASSIVSAPVAATMGLGSAATGVALGAGVAAPAAMGAMKIAAKILEAAGATAIRSPKIAAMSARLAQVAAAAPRTAAVAGKLVEHGAPVVIQALGDLAADKEKNLAGGLVLGGIISAPIAGVGIARATRPANLAMDAARRASKAAGGVPLTEAEARAAIQAAHPNLAPEHMEAGVAKYNKAVSDDLAARHISQAASTNADDPTPRIQMIDHVLKDDSAAAKLQDDLYIQQRGGAAKNMNGQRNLEAIDAVLREEANAPNAAGHFSEAMSKGEPALRADIQREISMMGHDVVNGDSKQFLEHIHANPELSVLHSNLPAIENKLGRTSIMDARIKLRVQRFQGYIDNASLVDGVISPESADFLRAVNTYTKGKSGGLSASLGEHVALREKIQEDLAKLAGNVDMHHANIATSRASLETHLTNNTARYPEQARMAQLLDAVDRYDGVSGSYSDLKLKKLRAEIVESQALGRTTPEQVALEKIIGAKNALRSDQEKTFAHLMDLNTIDHTGMRVVSGARTMEINGAKVSKDVIAKGTSLINTLSDIVGSGQSLQPHLGMLRDAAQSNPRLASMFDTWVSSNFESAIATGSSLRPTAYMALDMLRPHVAGDQLKLLNMLEVAGRIMDEDATMLQAFTSDVAAAISSGDSAAMVGMLGRSSDIAARLTSKVHISQARNYAQQLSAGYVDIATAAGMESGEALRTFQYLVGDEISRIRLHPQMVAKYGSIDVAAAVGNKIAVNRVINKTWFDTMDESWKAINMFGDGKALDRDFLTAYFLDASCRFGETGFFTQRMTSLLEHFQASKAHVAGDISRYTPAALVEDAITRRSLMGYTVDVQRLNQAFGQGRNEGFIFTRDFTDMLYGKSKKLLASLEGIYDGNIRAAQAGFNGKDSSEILKVFNGSDGIAGFVGHFDQKTSTYVQDNYGRMIHEVFVTGNRGATISQRLNEFLATSGIALEDIVPKYGHLVEMAAKTNPENGRLPAIEALADHLTSVFGDLDHLAPREFANAFQAHALQESVRYSAWRRMNQLLKEQSTTAGITYAPIEFRSLAFTAKHKEEYVGATNGFMENGGILFGSDKQSHKFFHSSIESQIEAVKSLTRHDTANPILSLFDNVGNSLQYGATDPAKQVLRNKGELMSRIGFTDAAKWVNLAVEGYAVASTGAVHTGIADTFKRILYTPRTSLVGKLASDAAYILGDPILRATASSGITSLSTVKALTKNFIGMNVKVMQMHTFKGGNAATWAVSPVVMAWRLAKFNGEFVPRFLSGIFADTSARLKRLSHSPLADEVGHFVGSNLKTPAGISRIQNIVTNLHAGRGVETSGIRGWSQRIGNIFDDTTGAISTRLQENMEHVNNTIHAREGARMYETLVTAARNGNLNLHQIETSIAPEFGSLSNIRHIEMASSILQAAKNTDSPALYTKGMLDFTLGYHEHMVGRFGKFGGSIFMNTHGRMAPGAAMFYTAKTQALVDVVRTVNPSRLSELLFGSSAKNIPPTTSIHMLSALFSIAGITAFLYGADYGSPEIMKEGVAKLAGETSTKNFELHHEKMARAMAGVSPGASETAIFGSTISRAYQSKGNVTLQILADLAGINLEGDRAGGSTLFGIAESAMVRAPWKIIAATEKYYSAMAAYTEKLNSSKADGYYIEGYAAGLEADRQKATEKLLEDIKLAVANSTFLKILGGGFMKNPLVSIPAYLDLGEAYWQNAFETTTIARADAKAGTFAEPIKANMQAWGLDKYYTGRMSDFDTWLAMMVESENITLEDAKRLSKNQSAVGMVTGDVEEVLPEDISVSDSDKLISGIDAYKKKLSDKAKKPVK